MSHIFVSYSRKDGEAVDNIAARLQRDGFEVWLDREDIKGGELWRESIVKAIDNAYAFVLMLSPDSAASENVRKEVDLAEGAGKTLLPLLLAPVQPPARLRYQLAGIQWIEYYRDSESKYVELAEALRIHRQESVSAEKPGVREVELVIGKINLSKFGPEQQEKLLNFVAEITDTPRAKISIAKMAPGSVHTFVHMPADSAYRLKTAALNRNRHLANSGVEALRLSGDRRFISPQSGRISSLKDVRSNGTRWFIRGLFFFLAALMSVLILSGVVPSAIPVITSFFSSDTPTPTNTFTPTQTFTYTPSATPTSTASPTQTPTFTPSATNTSTPTPNPPTAFSENPGASPESYSGLNECNDFQVTISTAVSDPSGISDVMIYYRLVNKYTRATTQWSTLPMIFTTTNFLGIRGARWERTISSSDLPGISFGEHWFQFYFLATDNVGAQTSSKIFGDRVTLICSYLG